MAPDAFLDLIRIVLGLAYGLVLGSFATVLVARVPSRESIGGRSRCPSCAAKIRAIDNVPLLSWMALRGRCRTCKRAISWRYPAMEATAGLLGLYIAIQPWSFLVFLAWLAALPALLALTVIDFDTKRLPDPLTLPVAALALAMLSVDDLLGSAHAVAGAFIGAVSLSAFYLLLNLISGGGMGMGDVKLALVIGALTGYLGWEYVVGATFLAFLTGSLVSVVLMMLGRAGRKSTVPFGPFMILGLYAVLPIASTFVRLYSF